MIPVFNRFIKLSNWGKVVAELYGMNDMLSFWGVALAIASLANLANSVISYTVRQSGSPGFAQPASLAGRVKQTRQRTLTKPPRNFRLWQRESWCKHVHRRTRMRISHLPGQPQGLRLPSLSWCHRRGLRKQRPV